jgi:hypothetical protein
MHRTCLSVLCLYVHTHTHTQHAHAYIQACTPVLWWRVWWASSNRASASLATLWTPLAGWRATARGTSSTDTICLSLTCIRLSSHVKAALGLTCFPKKGYGALQRKHKIGSGGCWFADFVPHLSFSPFVSSVFFQLFLLTLIVLMHASTSVFVIFVYDAQDTPLNSVVNSKSKVRMCAFESDIYSSWYTLLNLISFEYVHKWVISVVPFKTKYKWNDCRKRDDEDVLAHWGSAWVHER